MPPPRLPLEDRGAALRLGLPPLHSLVRNRRAVILSPRRDNETERRLYRASSTSLYVPAIKTAWLLAIGNIVVRIVLTSAKGRKKRELVTILGANFDGELCRWLGGED